MTRLEEVYSHEPRGSPELEGGPQHCSSNTPACGLPTIMPIGDVPTPLIEKKKAQRLELQRKMREQVEQQLTQDLISSVAVTRMERSVFTSPEKAQQRQLQESETNESRQIGSLVDDQEHEVWFANPFFRTQRLWHSLAGRLWA